MASSSDVYLPDFSRCLVGETLVISWDNVLSTILSHSHAPLDRSSAAFLSSEPAKHLLSLKSTSFPRRSVQSKNKFETCTAAINVSRSAQAANDIDEIKEDALWLSEEVGLDELEALRITFLERQERAQRFLKECCSEAEHASLRDALGQDYRSLLQVHGFIVPPSKRYEELNSRDRRRSTLLALHLEEEKGLIGVSKELLEAASRRRGHLQDGSSTDVASSVPRDTGLTDLAASLSLVIYDESSPDQCLSAYVSAMKAILDDLDHGMKCSLQEDLEDECSHHWMTVNIQKIALIADIILLYLRAERFIASTENVLAWLRCMNQCSFFASPESGSEEHASLVGFLQSTIAIVTLSFLNPTSSVLYILHASASEQASSTFTEKSPFFLDIDAAKEIHECLRDAAYRSLVSATPAILSWGLILYALREIGQGLKDEREGRHVQRAIDLVASSESSGGRRSSGSSLSSTQQSIYEDVLDHVNQYFDEDPVEFMIEASMLRLHVFEYICHLSVLSGPCTSVLAALKLSVLQDLLKVAVPVIEYSADIITAQVAILGQASRCVEPLPTHPTLQEISPCTMFIRDDFLMRDVFEVAASRFPYEVLPFVQLCRLLLSASDFDNGVPLVVNRLKSMTSFTQEAIAQFAAFHTTREDENANLVELEADAEMIAHDRRRLISLQHDVSRSTYLIPAGTTGDVVSDVAPPVIRWHHRYSAIGLLGLWLTHHHWSLPEGSLSSREASVPATSEIIALLASILERSLDNLEAGIGELQALENANSLLASASSAIGQDDDDIVATVLDIFESELQGIVLYGANRNCDVLNACMRFLLVIMKLMPERVWSMVSRSSLLGSPTHEGALVAVLISTDANIGCSDFFELCTRLYCAFVDVSLASLTSRNHDVSKPRKLDPPPIEFDLSTQIYDVQLLAFSRVMVDALEKWTSSNSESDAQACRIKRNLFRTFETVISAAFGADDNPDLRAKLTSTLASSALYIVDVFTFDLPDGSPAASPLRSIVYALHEPDSLVGTSTWHDYGNCGQAAISFCNTLIRIRRMLGKSRSQLEIRLLDLLPILVRAISSHHGTREVAVTLLKDLLASGTDVHPPSILSHLGSSSSTRFLDILCSLVEHSGDHIGCAALDLLTQLIGENQQWSAMALLSERVPLNSQRPAKVFEATNLGEPDRKPLLRQILDRLANDIELMDRRLAIAMLEFVAKAQENWVWSHHTLQSHSKFFAATLGHVINLNTGTVDEMRQCLDSKIASLVVQLATTHLHHAKSVADPTAVKRLYPLMIWLTANAVEVGAYNTSLHANLRKNFFNKYNPCTLANFKRTGLKKIKFGPEYFYDVDLATILLFRDRHRLGRETLHGQSFAGELRRANLNLSLVESEVCLLHNCQVFFVEHCSLFAQDREVQKVMAHVVKKCLNANTRASQSEVIFEAIYLTRAEFALALIQCLVDVKAKGSDFTCLIVDVWECIRSRNATFESAFSNGDMVSYRTMLSIMILSFQFHVQRAQRARLTMPTPTSVVVGNANGPLIREITEKIIVEGFQTVVRLLHDQQIENGKTEPPGLQDLITSKDLQLLLSLLQSVLRLADAPQIVSQISNALSSSGLLQSCMLLYSWSHVFASQDDNGTPSYGEISLRFLVSLSSLPLVAEQLAVEGVLTRLSTCRTTQSLRTNVVGVSPFDRQPSCRSLYAVWSSGILPLCLNLLTSVGRALAGEISAFLNQFHFQYSRALTAFAAPSGSRAGDAGFVSLALANETATLALVSHILLSYRVAGASAGVDSSEIMPLAGYDENKKELIEDLEDVLANGQKQLKSRLVATDEREAALRKSKDGDVLENRVAAELRSALLCLKRSEQTDAA